MSRKLLHSPDVLRRKAFNADIAALDEVQKLLDHAFASAALGNAAAHVLADVPVHIDEFSIDGAERIPARIFDDGYNLGESALVILD
jgi:hypothetical protein